MLENAPMAQFPCLPLWTDALNADTEHLTDDEFGKYMRLLIKMWRTPGCRVPNDDAWLSKHLRQTPSDVANVLRNIISEFCQNDGNWITQKRLLREYAKRFEFGKVQSDRAKTRWHKGKKHARAGNAPLTLTLAPKDFLTLERASTNSTVDNSKLLQTLEAKLEKLKPSASERATALDESAPARSPLTEKKPEDLSLKEINQRWRPAGTRPPD